MQRHCLLTLLHTLACLCARHLAGACVRLRSRFFWVCGSTDSRPAVRCRSSAFQLCVLMAASCPPTARTAV